jgi:hypothetical protein
VRLATEAQADRCVGTRLLFELFIAKEAELRFEALLPGRLAEPLKTMRHAKWKENTVEVNGVVN